MNTKTWSSSPRGSKSHISDGEIIEKTARILTRLNWHEGSRNSNLSAPCNVTSASSYQWLNSSGTLRWNFVFCSPLFSSTHSPGYTRMWFITVARLLMMVRPVFFRGTSVSASAPDRLRISRAVDSAATIKISIVFNATPCPLICFGCALVADADKITRGSLLSVSLFLHLIEYGINFQSCRVWWSTFPYFCIRIPVSRLEWWVRAPRSSYSPCIALLLLYLTIGFKDGNFEENSLQQRPFNV